MDNSQNVLLVVPLKIKRPLFDSDVNCGFPSPADDFFEKYLDPEDLYYQHPKSTFFARAAGDSMLDAGILVGDILVIDTSLTPRNNDIVIAVLNGEATCKFFVKENDKLIALIPANRKYRTIYVTPSMEFRIFGVVTYIIGKRRS